MSIPNKTNLFFFDTDLIFPMDTEMLKSALGHFIYGPNLGMYLSMRHEK